MGGCASLAANDPQERRVTSARIRRGQLSERTTATSDQDSVSSNESGDNRRKRSHSRPPPVLSTQPIGLSPLSEAEIASLLYRPSAAASTEDAQEASWFDFLGGGGRTNMGMEGASSARNESHRAVLEHLKARWTVSTQPALAQRVKAYCGDNDDLWAALLSRQLMTPKGLVKTDAPSLKNADIIFDRVLSHSDVESSCPAYSAPCHPFAGDSILLPGSSFPRLMAELRLKDDIHLLYYCSRLAGQTGCDLKALDDVWCISRNSWRRGCVLLDALCPAGQIEVAQRLAREIDAASIGSAEFRHLYSFLWQFAPTTTGPQPVRRTDGSQSPARKSIPHDDAVEFWRLLVPPSRWPYISDWMMFLGDSTSGHARRNVTSDQWRQFLDFMLAFSAEADFRLYNPAAASWPSLMDEFVEWRNNRDPSATPTA